MHKATLLKQAQSDGVAKGSLVETPEKDLCNSRLLIGKAMFAIMYVIKIIEVRMARGWRIRQCF